VTLLWPALDILIDQMADGPLCPGLTTRMQAVVLRVHVDDLNAVLASLADAGHRPLALPLPGHGWAEVRVMGAPLVSPGDGPWLTVRFDAWLMP
jgi:hypothetical protein